MTPRYLVAVMLNLVATLRLGHIYTTSQKVRPNGRKRRRRPKRNHRKYQATIPSRSSGVVTLSTHGIEGIPYLLMSLG